MTTNEQAAQPFGTGRLPDEPDPRDWPVRAFMTPKILPKMLDLEPRLGPILNQRDTPHCVAYTAAVIKQFQERKQSRRTYLFDADAMYARCKVADRAAGRWAGDGTFARTACDVVKNQGYGRLAQAWEPNATQFRIDGYARVFGISEMEQALHQFGPLFLGVSWFDAWFYPERSNMLLSTPARPVNGGGHEITICGYDRSGRRFNQPVVKIRNSWGAEWGEDGCAYITYEELERQLALPERIAADMWSTVDWTPPRSILMPAEVNITPPANSQPVVTTPAEGV